MKLLCTLAFLGFVALGASYPQDSSEEVFQQRVRWLGGGGGESTRNYGILKKFNLENITVDFQIKNKDSYHEFCLRIHALESLLGEKVIKPCIGIGHERSDDDKTTILYRFRIGRFNVYSGKIATNKNLSSCATIPVVGRVCVKDLNYEEVPEEDGKKRTICFKVGLKSQDKTYDVCGSFIGLKLAEWKCEEEGYTNEMDELPEIDMPSLDE